MPLIQDIEHIKYNLLKAIGQSLDLQTNCIEFLKVLLENLQCTSGYVWIFEHAIRPSGGTDLKLVSALPKIDHQLTNIPKDHNILQELSSSNNYLIYDGDHPNLAIFNQQENNLNEVNLIFKLGKLGFIRLICNSIVITDAQAASLVEVFNRFTITIHGAIAFQKLHVEQAEKIKAQRDLEATEQKYRFVVEGLSEGIIITDLEGRIVFVNDKMMSLSGYNQEALIGKNIVTVFRSRNNSEKVTKRFSEKKYGDTEEYLIEQRHKSGKAWIARIKESPYRSAANQIIGKLGLVMDVTEAKRAEAELLAAKHVAEKAQRAEQQFLANMSHEIRTPMNAVIGMTDLLSNTELTEAQKDFVDSLKFSADSLMGVINSILDLSKIEAGKLEFEKRPINLQKLMYGLQQTFHYKLKDKGVEVQMILDDKLEHQIIGDPTRLNQVLTNLMGNAAKFTKKGFIKLRAKLVRKTESTYTILFEVIDSGIGIEAEKIKVIFENFKQANKEVTRKYGGTGLGLAIVKQIVELQNGHIEVLSEKGKGSTFKVTLEFPFTIQEEPQDVTQYPENMDDLFQENRFLIVEDNLMNQKLITKLMNLWSANFDLAIDGLDALKKSKAKKYDLIFMDINMPEMDGYETTIAIRNDPNNFNSKTIIIALSAAVMLKEKNKALQVGMNDFVAKPFNALELKSKIGYWLSQNQSKEKSKLLTIPKTGVQGIRIDKIPQIDLTYLKDMSNGDNEFVQEMLKIFIAQIPATIIELKIKFSSKEWKDVADLAHKVKTNFMMIGLNQQKEDAAAIENMIKTNQINEEKITFLIERMVDKTDLAIPILKEKIDKID